MVWQTGQSGNPKGRPVDRPWREAIKRALVRAEADGNHKSLNALAEKLLTLAAEGDMVALKELADRLEGKPHQQVQVQGDEEHPLRNINVNVPTDAARRDAGDPVAAAVSAAIQAGKI